MCDYVCVQCDLSLHPLVSRAPQASTRQDHGDALLGVHGICGPAEDPRGGDQIGRDNIPICSTREENRNCHPLAFCTSVLGLILYHQGEKDRED